MTEDEMVGWHHQLCGREFEQVSGVGDGQGGLVCCGPRLIIFFAATDGEALYSQQKQDPELTVAQFMNSSLPNSDSN